MSRKSKYYNNFEDLYLRRDYLSRIGNMNVSDIDDHKYIIQKTAKIVYDKYFIVFKHVGFDLEDISSILNLYALYYMNLYSLKNNKIYMDDYVQKFKNKNGSDAYPSAESIKRTERNNLINFLRHKSIRLLILCKNKKTNIVTGKDERKRFAATKNSKTSCPELIMRDPDSSGYRNVTIREFKEAKIKAKENGTRELKDKDGFGIIEIDSYVNTSTLYDYGETCYNHIHDLTHGNDPEEIMIGMEDNSDMENIKYKLSRMSKREKRAYINKFIKENKDGKMDKEIAIAKSMRNRIAKNKENEIF